MNANRWSRFGALLLATVAAPALWAQSLLLVLPPPAVQAVADAAQQLRPWQFAVSLPVAITAEHDGVWQTEGAERIWRLELHSPGARSLSLHFDQWQLPPGARLTVTGIDSGLRAGPYGPTREGVRELWTALLPDATLALELRLPAQTALAPNLRLATVHHGFRSADPALGYRYKAGACNVDVACPEARPFADQARATLLLVIGGNSSCTGSLINNTANDQRPLVLTADHCQIRDDNAQSVVAHFNFERDQCQTGQTDRNRTQVGLDPNRSVSGAEFLATAAQSDFTLLVLGSRAQPAVVDPAWEAYWVGWTRDTQPAQSGASIHHPSGDEKSIALFDSPVRARSANQSIFNVETWEVVWDRGTTEPGSSGAGLLGADGLLRGQLTGGQASCGNQDAPDEYGRFDVAWDDRLAADQRLQPWLDPSGQGGNPLRWPGLNFDGTLQRLDGSPTPTPKPTSTPVPPPDDDGGSGALSGEWLLLLLLVGLGHRRRVSR